jgi:adenylate cyclase
VFGDGVNVASRLQELSEPGEIRVSAVVREQVGEKRRALGDDGTAQRLIRTFTRKGIRFVGEFTEIADSITPDKPSIAVLPFQNMTGDPEQEYFADGVVEEITSAIARSAWLFVIARNSSFALRAKASM